MEAELQSAHVPREQFDPTIVTFTRPTHHYSYLHDKNGDWLGTEDGKTLFIQGFVDDAVIWDLEEDGFAHAKTGLHLSSTNTTLEEACELSLGGQKVGDDGSLGSAGEFTVGHGPEYLPSEYLEFLNEKGWVSLTCVLSPSVVDGLQRVGCVDKYADRQPERKTPLAQDPSVTKVTTEPISLWLTREYMKTKDIRLGHSPGVSALPPDDGVREVQGWHNDFPYLWGTGDRIPVPSGDLVLGMQRNVCVSDFNRNNGATIFKLGSHAVPTAPPEEWGISNHTYRKGHRAKFGLPYAGPDADLIEAPAGSLVLYDARTWHRAGFNMSNARRGAMIQAIVPSFIIPFMDTSSTFKQFLQSDAIDGVTEREKKEIDKLMVHKITGPAGLFAITTDPELTERVRSQYTQRASAY